MKVFAAITSAILLAACSSSTRVSQTSNEYTIVCPSGWTECEERAEKYCGKRGYEQVAKPRMGGVTTASRGGDARAEDIFRRATKGESRSRNQMTIRCK